MKPKVHSPCRMGRSKPPMAANFGIGVQRVAVAGQPVEQRLIGAGGVGDRVVGVAVGDWRPDRRAPVAAPAALAPDEQRNWWWSTAAGRSAVSVATVLVATTAAEPLS